jgi:signal transduction histidine kinase/ActR/RegA family two-component response regulator
MSPSARAPLLDSVIRATRVDRTRAERYGLAFALTLISFALGWWLRPMLGASVLFVLFYPAVMVAAWFGGLGPGLLATALTGTAVAALEDQHAGSAVPALGFLLIGIATSLLSEVLHEARRQQEKGARRSAELIELRLRLEETVMALPEPLSMEQMAEIILGQGGALLGMRSGTLAVLDDGGSELRTVGAVGYPPGVQARTVTRLESGEPLAEAVRLKAPVVPTAGQTAAALPLLLRGRVIGGMSFDFGGERRFRESDLSVLQALAYEAALALEGARRYEREQSARRQAEALGERHRLLAGAHACLAASLDYEANLRDVCRLAVPAFAQSCLVHLRNAEGALILLAAKHEDAERSADLEAFGRALEEAEGFREVVASRRPGLGEPAAWLGEGPGALEERLALGSALAVPLVARDRALGIITFMRSRGGRAFDGEDVELGRDLAGRSAAAVDNALLFTEARRLNRVKDEFLALLSHELRTPLGSALVWLDLLRAEPLEAGAVRAAEMAQRSARQLADLIDQLLDMSRTVAGKLSIEKQTTDLVAVVEGVVAAAAPAATAKGVRLEAEIDRSLERLWADPSRLRQAIGSLVSNAIKFTPGGGSVTVRLEHAGSVARLQVCDTGVGIASDVLPFIFERFRLGDTKSTRAQGGLGLGLAIAQYICEQHEGTLRATSDGPGRGSVFTLDLPLRPPPGQAPVPSASADRAPLGSLRVLLVDDHRETLHGLAMGLTASGAEVTPVSSVREAMAALPRVRPDVIVSDLAMPEQDGYTLIAQVRRLTPEAGGLIPAVAVSASAGPADRLRALRSGYQEHVAKPVELSRLVATIERLAVRAGALD